MSRLSKEIVRLRFALTLIGVIFVFFASASFAYGATYSWDDGGGDSNWSTCDNWSTNICPGSGDIAQFDTTSSANATLDTSFAGSVAGVNITADYTGTITQDRDFVVGISSFTMASGTWSQGAGTFDFSTDNLTITAGSFTAAAGTTTIDGSFQQSGTFDANNGVINFFMKSTRFV